MGNRALEPAVRGRPIGSPSRWRDRLVDYLVLSQPGFAALPAFPFAIGGLSVSPARAAPVLLLTGAGFLLGVYGRHLDDLTDLDDDGINPARQDSPLVRGRVSPAQLARWTAVEGVLLAVGAWFLAPTLTTRVGFLIVLGLRTWLGGFATSSRLIPPWACDYLAGAARGAPLPLAVLAAGGELSWPALLLAAAFGLHLVVATSTVGNLKDITTDRAVRARTTALELGVRLRHPKGFVFPRRYVAAVLVAQAGLLAAVTASCAVAVSSWPDAGVGVGAVGAALFASGWLVRLVRRVHAGATWFDPLRSMWTRGVGFIVADLVACDLAAVAWLTGAPAVWAAVASGCWLAVVVAVRLRLRLRRPPTGPPANPGAGHQPGPGLPPRAPRPYHDMEPGLEPGLERRPGGPASPPPPHLGPSATPRRRPHPHPGRADGRGVSACAR